MLRRRLGLQKAAFGLPKAASKTEPIPVKMSKRRLPRGRRKMIYTIPIIVVVLILATWKTIVDYLFPLAVHTYYISEISGFHPEWHPLTRAERFPCVEQRVKLYMSNWYLPPCNGTDGSLDERLRYMYDYAVNKSLPSVHITNYGTEESDEPEDTNAYVHINAHVSVDVWLDTNLRPDEPVVLWDNALDPCLITLFEDSYCPDLSNTVSLVKNMTKSKQMADLPPIIGQFGDHPVADLQRQHVPFIKKFRNAAHQHEIQMVTQEKSGLDCNAAIPDQGRRKLQHVGSRNSENVVDTFSPILWLLNSQRHFGWFSKARLIDVSWELKNNTAVWRGLLTGELSDEEKEGKSFLEVCELLPRCKFVKDNVGSKILDVGANVQHSLCPMDDDHLNMLKGTLTIREQMLHKAIIVIEGNDVATGLKWALYCRSVVLMAPPTKTSYAMEEMLVPWVHYIPLKADLSDAEEMMQWVIDNDEKARKIAERATLFMHDLLFHEDAEKDNLEVSKEMMRRYMAFFKK